jgi:hypothetical protein
MKYLKSPQELNEASENLNISDVSDSKLYTEQEVKKIINILVRNERNITYSISQGRNSVKRFLIDFNDGKYK